MTKDESWPDVCTLTGCIDPTLRPHHHHLEWDNLSVIACGCADVSYPGTSPRKRKT